MMSKQDVIALYEAMSALKSEMLCAARAQDWELLAVLESRCSEHVKTLEAQEPQQTLPIPEHEQQIKIIQKILADDLEMRALTKAGMAQLATLINSAHTERKLSNAYGA
jgi:flagellar protein FliT